MKTICLYLNGNYESALNTIFNSIPSLINYGNDGSIAITCREEDAAFVERKLRDFV